MYYQDGTSSGIKGSYAETTHYVGQPTTYTTVDYSYQQPTHSTTYVGSTSHLAGSTGGYNSSYVNGGYTTGGYTTGGYTTGGYTTGGYGYSSGVVGGTAHRVVAEEIPV